VGVKPHSWFEDPPPERWFAEEEPAPGAGARPRPYAAEIEPATEDLGALSFPREPEPDAVSALRGSGLGEVVRPVGVRAGVTVGLGLLAFCALVVLAIVAWPQVLAWLGWP
jgi:hypothetical protein